jgi:hypothetical protein
MQNARSKPPSSKRPESRRVPRTSTSSWPPKGIARLDEALADAEKVAKRVDRALEEDPFAAALLAREYLSLVPELDVNPLNQRGRTEAWTSAFVRLRVASNVLDRDHRRADGEAYLAARAEERRLFGLFGNTPHARLTAARAEARGKRARKRAFRMVGWVWAMAGVIAAGGAFALHRGWIAGVACLAAAIGAAAWFAAAAAAGRSFKGASRRAHELEQGISGLDVFQKSDHGRAIIQRIQAEHPLLVRTSLTEGGSSPPAALNGHAATARKTRVVARERSDLRTARSRRGARGRCPRLPPTAPRATGR